MLDPFVQLFVLTCYSSIFLRLYIRSGFLASQFHQKYIQIYLTPSRFPPVLFRNNVPHRHSWNSCMRHCCNCKSTFIESGNYNSVASPSRRFANSEASVDKGVESYVQRTQRFIGRLMLMLLNVSRVRRNLSMYIPRKMTDPRYRCKILGRLHEGDISIQSLPSGRTRFF